jgi:hypothetical protein
VVVAEEAPGSVVVVAVEFASPGVVFWAVVVPADTSFSGAMLGIVMAMTKRAAMISTAGP